LLENLVAVHLKRIGKEAYYFLDRNGSEADFYIPGTGEILQVCYDLNDMTAKRELIGLERAARYLRPKNAMILTYNQEREIHIKDLKVSVKPAWKWLLETELSRGYNFVNSNKHQQQLTCLLPHDGILFDAGIIQWFGVHLE
jgi:predicted AAA+ superfamily ATPase